MSNEKVDISQQVLVSVITPAHNSALYISDAIESVQRQTLNNWEMFVIDDASSDNTATIVKSYSSKDKRIKYIGLQTNQGPSVARQKGTLLATGRYIAFLDSDDVWYESKLEQQIKFMQDHNCAFSCTAYEQVDEVGRPLGKVITPPQKADYNRVLLDCPVGNSTVVYDTKILGKCFGPDIKNREDYGLWLKILKKENFVWGIRDILSKYRVRKKSQSRNKFKLIIYQWILYRDFEHLSVLRSLFHVLFWCFIKVLRLK